jgi:hypothetical protein
MRFLLRNSHQRIEDMMILTLKTIPNVGHALPLIERHNLAKAMESVCKEVVKNRPQLEQRIVVVETIEDLL